MQLGYAKEDVRRFLIVWKEFEAFRVILNSGLKIIQQTR